MPWGNNQSCVVPASSCLTVALAVLLAGCGSDKKDNSTVKLPQKVSYLDGAVSFSLPEGWLSVPASDRSQEAFVILNNPELVNEFDNTEDISDSAVNAFAFAYDPTYSLDNSYLETQENVVLGVVVVLPVEQLGQDMNPKEIIEFIVEQGKANLQGALDNGTTDVVYDQSVYDLDQSKIKTFNNGALIQFKSAGNFPGMLGIIRTGENFAAVFLATDKPDQYMDTFESIIRSVRITESPLPVVTEEPIPTIAPMPTSSVPLIIVVTGTPPDSMFQDENGQTIIVITATPAPATITPLPTITAAPSATPFSAVTSLPTIPVEPPTPLQTETGNAAATKVNITNVLSWGDVSNEAVGLRNEGDPVNLLGWSLVSTNGDVFYFPEYRMFPGSMIQVYTRQGSNTPVALYWGLDHPVWVAGDTVSLLDASGQAQSTFRVGDPGR